MHACMHAGPLPVFILVVFGAACAIAFVPESRALPGLGSLWELSLFLLGCV